MFAWFKNIGKSREQLVDEELSRPDFVEIYLASCDQGKAFQKACKIPKGNIFRPKQFDSWCAYMVAFTFEQELYKKLNNVPNFDRKRFIEKAKDAIQEKALKVMS